MLKKAFTDSSFYVINGTSLMALYFKKYFFFWNFCGCLFMFNENEIKPDKLLLRCFLLLLCQSVYEVYHSTFPHGLELKTKNKIATLQYRITILVELKILKRNRNTYRIGTHILC